MLKPRMFLICPVRNATVDITSVVKNLERSFRVHWPPRDTNQKSSNGGVDICLCNTQAIRNADVIGVWWDSKSKGSHFDLGVAFALQKSLIIINKPECNLSKSFVKVMRLAMEKDDDMNTHVYKYVEPLPSYKGIEYRSIKCPDCDMIKEICVTAYKDGQQIYYVCDHYRRTWKPKWAGEGVSTLVFRKTPLSKIPPEVGILEMVVIQGMASGWTLHVTTHEYSSPTIWLQYNMIHSPVFLGTFLTLLQNHLIQCPVETRPEDIYTLTSAGLMFIEQHTTL